MNDGIVTTEGNNVNKVDINLTNELYGKLDISKTFESAKSKGQRRSLKS